MFVFIHTFNEILIMPVGKRVKLLLYIIYLIKESENPKRNLVAFADVALVDGVEGFCFTLQFGAVFSNLELQLFIDEEGAEVSMFVHLMVFPKCVAEEGFQHIVLVEATWIEAVHEIGVVEKYTCWFFGEFITLSIYHVYQPSFFQIFNVVHHRGAAHPQFLCQLAYVGHAASTGGQHIEKLFDFNQIFQFYLLYQQDVHLNHHVHVLQQILAVVHFIQEEGVETVMQIRLEIFTWIHF